MGFIMLYSKSNGRKNKPTSITKTSTTGSEPEETPRKEFSLLNLIGGTLFVLIMVFILLIPFLNL